MCVCVCVPVCVNPLKGKKKKKDLKTKQHYLVPQIIDHEIVIINMIFFFNVDTTLKLGCAIDGLIF